MLSSRHTSVQVLHEAILPLDFVEGIGLPNVLNPPQEHVRIAPPRRHGDCCMETVLLYPTVMHHINRTSINIVRVLVQYCSGECKLFITIT